MPYPKGARMSDEHRALIGAGQRKWAKTRPSCMHCFNKSLRLKLAELAGGAYNPNELFECVDVPACERRIVASWGETA